MVVVVVKKPIRYKRDDDDEIVNFDVYVQWVIINCK